MQLKMAAPGGVGPPHAAPKTAALPLCEEARMAVPEGFAPPQTEPESVVLLLHHGTFIF